MTNRNLSTDTDYLHSHSRTLRTSVVLPKSMQRHWKEKPRPLSRRVIEVIALVQVRKIRHPRAGSIQRKKLSSIPLKNKPSRARRDPTRMNRRLFLTENPYRAHQLCGSMPSRFSKALRTLYLLSNQLQQPRRAVSLQLRFPFCPRSANLQVN